MSSPFTLMPHAVCWRQDPALIWTMAATNAVTFLSYTAICVTLFYLARRTQRVIAKDWAFFVVGFALFIVACGSTHLMEVVTTWTPVFWVDAWTNIVTAMLSGYVAVQFFRRAQQIGFGINDYAERLDATEDEKVRMQESLIASRKLEDWSRMSATMSHEIANPLEAIQNLLYLARETPGTPPAAQDFMRKAADESMRVLTIARATLGFFRGEGEPEAMDLRAAAESVHSVLEAALRDRMMRLEIKSTGDTTVRAHAGEARQVLLNLVRNAIEASRARGTVEVHLQGEQAGVEIVVTDQGAGIDAALLPDLFQFGRTTKGAAGNGMGLWTVRQIMLRHGGDIGVESELGKGTRFTLWWPREAPVAVPEEAAVPVSALAAEAAREVFEP